MRNTPDRRDFAGAIGACGAGSGGQSLCFTKNLRHRLRRPLLGYERCMHDHLCFDCLDYRRRSRRLACRSCRSRGRLRPAGRHCRRNHWLLYCWLALPEAPCSSRQRHFRINRRCGDRRDHSAFRHSTGQTGLIGGTARERTLVKHDVLKAAGLSGKIMRQTDCQSSRAMQSVRVALQAAPRSAAFSPRAAWKNRSNASGSSGRDKA